jgi:uncharacterized paraquat-inducible protein A
MIGSIIAVIVVIILTLTYSEDQHLRCPLCELEFTADLIFFMDNSMAQCPFCHKWITIKKYQDRLDAKRLFT